MGQSDSKQTRQPNGKLEWFYKSFLMPFILAVATAIATSYIVREYEEDGLREKARIYADRLEAKNNLEIKRMKEDFEKKREFLQQAKKDSIKLHMSWLAERGLGYGGAAIKAKKTIGQHFDKLIEDEKTRIERFEEDARMQVESIRETGVILKLE